MNPPTILVVEDEVIVSRDIITSLESFRYQPLCAVRTGDEAVARAREYRPDVVLMDIHIPGSMDGLDAAQVIKDELDIPVIFITSYSDDTTLGRAKETSPYGYILKPFSDRGLKVAIEVALSRKNAEKQMLREADLRNDSPGEKQPRIHGKKKPSLSDIRSLLLENFFQDLVLLLYNDAAEKELVLASYIERSVKTTGDILFAYSISKSHRNFLREIQEGKIVICRMKEKEISFIKQTLRDFLKSPGDSPPLPRKIIIDFSIPFREPDVLAITDIILESRNQGIPVLGIIAVYVDTADDNLIKTLSKKIPKVLVTTSQGTVISCADYSFPFEHLSFLPQPVIDEIVKKMLEPVILSLLRKPVSGNDILREIQRRYNVSVPKARIYTYLYSLQKMGYLTTTSSGKSKIYVSTECGEQFIREKLNEFNSVFHHIQAEIVNCDPGVTIKDPHPEEKSL